MGLAYSVKIPAVGKNCYNDHHRVQIGQLNSSKKGNLAVNKTACIAVYLDLLLQVYLKYVVVCTHNLYYACISI